GPGGHAGPLYGRMEHGRSRRARGLSPGVVKGLTSNVEKVILLDEAYSLTSYESSSGDERRKLSAYSDEAVTEIVAFLSQRVGATCLIAAGYEQPMLNDFLPSNDGLRRRFPYRIWLRDYTSEQLVTVFLDALATSLSDPPPAQPLTRDTTRTYFSTAAITYLTDVLTDARSSTDTGATHPLLSQVFAAQAGAMVTLASVAALLIASSNRRGAIGTSDTGIDTWALSFIDVHDVIRTALAQMLGPLAREAETELQTIARANGWIANGAFQMPPSASPPRRRGSAR
ncbi:hypothetical protein OAO87_01255, partial [bacterium]|nr:hypothetical protein [bacterium]